MRGWESVKVISSAKNMSENNSECVGSSSSFSIYPSIPSIGVFPAPFGNFSPTLERVNYSTQNPPS